MVILKGFLLERKKKKNATEGRKLKIKIDTSRKNLYVDKFVKTQCILMYIKLVLKIISTYIKNRYMSVSKFT